MVAAKNSLAIFMTREGDDCLALPGSLWAGKKEGMMNSSHSHSLLDGGQGWPSSTDFDKKQLKIQNNMEPSGWD